MYHADRKPDASICGSISRPPLVSSSTTAKCTTISTTSALGAMRSSMRRTAWTRICAPTHTLPATYPVRVPAVASSHSGPTSSRTSRGVPRTCALAPLRRSFCGSTVNLTSVPKGRVAVALRFGARMRFFSMWIVGAVGSVSVGGEACLRKVWICSCKHFVRSRMTVTERDENRYHHVFVFWRLMCRLSNLYD